MDLQTLCIFVILASIVGMLVRAIVSAGRKPVKRVSRVQRRTPGGAFALDDALDKLNETIRIIHDGLGERTPGRHDPEGARFYIAYLTGIAREIAKMNHVAFGPALETPIRMEVIRLNLDGKSASDAMARLLASDEGQQGLAAGELDGVEACDPNYRGGYFSRIQSYFNDVEVRGQR